MTDKAARLVNDELKKRGIDLGSSRSESPAHQGESPGHPTLAAIGKLVCASAALEQIIGDPDMPDELVLLANATAERLQGYAIRWALQLSVERGSIAKPSIKLPVLDGKDSEGRDKLASRTLESDLAEDR